MFLRCELSEIFCNRDQINANSTFEKEYSVTPLLANNKEKRGLALDGKLKDEDTNLASSTMSVNLHYKSIRHIFMFIVQITALYFYTLQKTTLFLNDRKTRWLVCISLSLCSLQPDMDKQIQGVIVSYKIKVTLMMGGGLLGSLTLRFRSSYFLSTQCHWTLSGLSVESHSEEPFTFLFLWWLLFCHYGIYFHWCSNTTSSLFSYIVIKQQWK